MCGKLMLGITVPVLFSVIHVCALGKRFIFQITFILCVVHETRVYSKLEIYITPIFI